MLLRAIVSLALLAASSARAADPCVPVKPCEVEGAGTAVREPAADYAPQARQLAELLSCQGPVPEGLAPGPVKAYCARQAKLVARGAGARAALQTALQPVRPARLPSAAVFPLSAPDLLRVLATYPDARNVTLISSRACGDPRLADGLREPGRLAAFLSSVADEGEDLLRAMEGQPRRPTPARTGPGALALLLWALAVDGDEPVALKLVRVEPAGTLRYLGASEIASLEKVPGGPGPFDSCEIGFVQRGAPAGTLPRLARNLRADLSNAGVAADAGPLAHLDAKGSFAAVLADAGALSGDGASSLRELLLRRAAFTVSDGTGPSPEQVKQANLVEERAGRTLRIIRKP